jgi:hypothetical protein
MSVKEETTQPQKINEQHLTNLNSANIAGFAESTHRIRRRDKYFF